MIILLSSFTRIQQPNSYYAPDYTYFVFSKYIFFLIIHNYTCMHVHGLICWRINIEIKWDWYKIYRYIVYIMAWALLGITLDALYLSSP